MKQKHFVMIFLIIIASKIKKGTNLSQNLNLSVIDKDYYLFLFIIKINKMILFYLHYTNLKLRVFFTISYSKSIRNELRITYFNKNLQKKM